LFRLIVTPAKATSPLGGHAHPGYLPSIPERYEVSDTTLRDRGIRRTVLSHALLSYVFGVAIVGWSVDLIAGLIR